MFIIKYYCPDCTGKDFFGCNDGQPWYEENEDGSLNWFDYKEEAEKVAISELDSIYKYQIIEVDNVDDYERETYTHYIY